MLPDLSEFASHDYHLKFIVLGDTTSGKTSIVRRVLGKRFRPTHHQTVGVNIEHFVYELDDGRTAMISIWDLDGQSIFRNARNLYFNNTSGVIMVLDSTQQLDMQTLGWYFEDIEAGMQEHNFSVVLMGNKIDLEEERVLPLEFIQGTAILLADQIKAEDVRAFEVSARTGEGVREGFYWLVQSAITRIQRRTALLDQIFDPKYYPTVLFQLTENGPEAVLQDFSSFPNLDELTTDIFLMNLGVSMSVAIAQGHNYSLGAFDLPAGDKQQYRMFVYSFRLADPQTKDPRLELGFLQLSMFVPQQYREYFGQFSKVERRLQFLLNQFETVQDLKSENNLAFIKQEILKEFKATATLDQRKASPFD